MFELFDHQVTKQCLDKFFKCRKGKGASRHLLRVLCSPIQTSAILAYMSGCGLGGGDTAANPVSHPRWNALHK